jgi:tRNA(Ile)-lysidine synthase TilS/MesJ
LKVNLWQSGWSSLLGCDSGGILRLVRPLAYLAEKNIRRFARVMNFPPPPEDCPQAVHSSRKKAAKLLRLAEKGWKTARVNLLRARLKTMG